MELDLANVTGHENPSSSRSPSDTPAKLRGIKPNFGWSRTAVTLEGLELYGPRDSFGVQFGHVGNSEIHLSKRTGEFFCLSPEVADSLSEFEVDVYTSDGQHSSESFRFRYIPPGVMDMVNFYQSLLLNPEWPNVDVGTFAKGSFGRSESSDSKTWPTMSQTEFSAFISKCKVVYDDFMSFKQKQLDRTEKFSTADRSASDQPSASNVAVTPQQAVPSDALIDLVGDCLSTELMDQAIENAKSVVAACESKDRDQQAVVQRAQVFATGISQLVASLKKNFAVGARNQKILLVAQSLAASVTKFIQAAKIARQDLAAAYQDVEESAESLKREHFFGSIPGVLKELQRHLDFIQSALQDNIKAGKESDHTNSPPAGKLPNSFGAKLEAEAELIGAMIAQSAATIAKFPEEGTILNTAVVVLKSAKTGEISGSYEYELAKLRTSLELTCSKVSDGIKALTLHLVSAQRQYVAETNLLIDLQTIHLVSEQRQFLAEQSRRSQACSLIEMAASIRQILERLLSLMNNFATLEHVRGSITSRALNVRRSEVSEDDIENVWTTSDALDEINGKQNNERGITMNVLICRSVADISLRDTFFRNLSEFHHTENSPSEADRAL
eukprot:TRINITY_DN8204_c0_g1_i1.p1 TRINITY_DN8204_c0_g1~~TRINITY_DN8204_c0_g1_i1.p1  ORF type:complete len:673 (+),score=137.43 TRINITY_DN8204_c0_g1_i1:182-2020(+)